MAAEPKNITQPEFDRALTAFSGYVDHTVNMAKADLRREIFESEQRLSAKIDAVEARLTARIDGLEARLDAVEARLGVVEAKIDELRTELQSMQARFDRVESVGKANHQMMQLMLDQFSRINQKLGID